jgi:hypothetical protein
LGRAALPMDMVVITEADVVIARDRGLRDRRLS